MATLQCECGSSFFEQRRVEQFQAGGYGTAEFRSISNAPKTVLVCLCGKPVAPKPGYYAKGTLAAVQETDFAKSIELARKFREASSINNIANIAASPAELQELKDSFEAMKADIIALSRPTSTPQLTKESSKPKARKVKVQEAEHVGTSQISGSSS